MVYMEYIIFLLQILEIEVIINLLNNLLALIYLFSYMELYATTYIGCPLKIL